MTLDEMVNRFRLASRELFNSYFCFSDAAGKGSTEPPRPVSGEEWDHKMRFSQLEKTLFEKMVCEPAKLNHVEYGDVQQEIVVKLNSSLCPIMLNREIKSGYWDFPIRQVASDARLAFLKFFDWNVLAYRDNRYVLVQVVEWSSHPEVAGKQALIESQYVHFERAG